MERSHSGCTDLTLAQVAQTHVTSEGDAGVALQATVENTRDFVWEIYYWDLQTAK